jgi:hypothetical protein
MLTWAYTPIFSFLGCLEVIFPDLTIIWKLLYFSLLSRRCCTAGPCPVRGRSKTNGRWPPSSWSTPGRLGSCIILPSGSTAWDDWEYFAFSLVCSFVFSFVYISWILFLILLKISSNLDFNFTTYEIFKLNYIFYFLEKNEKWSEYWRTPRWGSSLPVSVHAWTLTPPPPL